MKNTAICLISAAAALALSSCAQMQPTSTKSKSSPNPPPNSYGSTQTFPTQQGANPYGTNASYGYANGSSYDQYQQSAGQTSRESDYVSVTPAMPQYTNSAPQPTQPTQPTQPAPQYGNTAPPQYANNTPAYQPPANPYPQMGSYQEAAQPAPPASYHPQPAQPAPGTVAQTHVVQPGETLYRISRMYDTTVSGIKGMNGLNSDLIRPGEVLSIP